MISDRDADLQHAGEAAVSVGSLIVLSGAVLVYEVWLGAQRESALGAFVAAWGLVPREFLRELASPGATLQVVWLTPITAMFLHAGLLHWIANVIYLWVFGGALEARIGHARFLSFYLICGLAAASVQVASAPGSFLPTIGASGAISGLLGAYAVCESQHRMLKVGSFARIRAWLFPGIWIVIQIISGLSQPAAEEGGIAWWAHIGGFCMGAGLMWARPLVSSRLRI